MKELSIKAVKYPEIPINCRDILEMRAISISWYAEDYYMYKYVLFHQRYINALFTSVDCLYKYYELSQKHFELLNFAAEYLEKLCNGKASCSSKPEEIEQAKKELGDYLDKVTMIFQTAADKAEDPHFRESYAAMAQKYSEKADRVCGRVTFKSYEAKMQGLYEKAASECNLDFIKKLLELRAAAYRDKCRENGVIVHGDSSSRFFADVSQGDQEVSESLLGAELRRRTITVPDTRSAGL